MSNPFQSARLLYRAVELPGTNQADDDFFLRLQRNALGFRNASSSLLRPVSQKQAADYQRWIAEESLLGVVICLPNNNDDDEANDSEAIGHQGHATDDEPDATPIGVLTLTLTPRESHHRYTEIIIDILPQHQNRGYGSEAIRWATSCKPNQKNSDRNIPGTCGSQTCPPSHPEKQKRIC